MGRRGRGICGYLVAAAPGRHAHAAPIDLDTKVSAATRAGIDDDCHFAGGLTPPVVSATAAILEGGSGHAGNRSMKTEFVRPPPRELGVRIGETRRFTIYAFDPSASQHVCDISQRTHFTAVRT